MYRLCPETKNVKQGSFKFFSFLVVVWVRVSDKYRRRVYHRRTLNYNISHQPYLCVLYAHRVCVRADLKIMLVLAGLQILCSDNYMCCIA